MLALLGGAVGLLVHQSAKAMSQPVAGNEAFFNVPINLTAVTAAANPGFRPSQSYSTTESTDPQFLPADRDQNALMASIETHLSNMQTQYQTSMNEHFSNAGDSIVLPQVPNITVTLTNDHEPYSMAYVAQKNQSGLNAAGRMLRPSQPIQGTVMGGNQWANK